MKKTGPIEKGIEPIIHKTLADSIAMHASGHKPHAVVYGEHAANFTKHDDHMKSFCMGGKTGKK
jgi:hypothetical protein